MLAVSPRKRLRDLSTAEKQERKEDALRPSRYLGYDRETIALYLTERGLWSEAEAQFRRMIWLNPFELRFRKGLIHCLLAQQRTAEAVQCAKEALVQFPGDPVLKKAGE